MDASSSYLVIAITHQRRHLVEYDRPDSKLASSDLLILTIDRHVGRDVHFWLFLVLLHTSTPHVTVSSNHDKCHESTMSPSRLDDETSGERECTLEEIGVDQQLCGSAELSHFEDRSTCPLSVPRVTATHPVRAVVRI